MKIYQLLKGYLYNYSFSPIVIFIFIMLFLRIQYVSGMNDLQVTKNSDPKVIKEITNNFLKEDFEHKFNVYDFKRFYSDIGYLLESKQINRDNKSLSEQFSKAREQKKFTKAMENFEKGSMATIIDKLIKRMDGIETFYFSPLYSSQGIYLKINAKDKSIYIFEKNNFESMTKNNNLVRFEAIGTEFFIPQKEIVDSYNKSLEKLVDFSKIHDNDITAKVSKITKDLIITQFVAYSLFLLYVLFTLFKYVSESLKNRELEYQKTLILQDENYKKEEELKFREDRLLKLEHVLQHDIKTNIDERLNHLSMMYDEIKQSRVNNESNNKILNKILTLYALDLTVKLSNDYARKLELRVANFLTHFKNEKLFSFANGTLDSYGEIGTIVRNEIIQIEICSDFDSINSFSTEGTFFENEFSSLVFRLINNALKHSADKRVYIYIGHDESNDFIIKIINKTKNIEKSMYEISTSLSSNDSVKNISFAKNNIIRFGMEISFSSDIEKSSIITYIKRNR